jgi:NOL1/NOP2/sun family putative RNA methylase
MKPEMKPVFEERMKKLLPNKEDFEKFSEIIHVEPKDFIRCNTLKITPQDLLVKLRKKWEMSQPFPEHPEIMHIDTELGPGQLGNAIEHVLGYYYVQEITSMMPVLALDPKPGDLVLDLCASPGSKTSQMAAKMENQGTIIANDLKIGRIKILSSTLQRTGVTNTISTRGDAIGLCAKFAKKGWKFDKILLDAPCSGEGTLRSSSKTFKMWNLKVVKSLSRQQKKFIAFAFKCLKKDGSIVYSTCTHSPEENESIVSFAKENFPVRVEQVKLPMKCRPGVTSWGGEDYTKDAEKCCRIYPQDNDSEGFFVSKLTLLEEVNDNSKQNI